MRLHARVHLCFVRVHLCAVYTYCAEKLPTQHKRKLQKHLQAMSTTVKGIVCVKTPSSAAAVDIVDFSGNTAGVQRRGTIIAHAFNLHRKTCTHRYTHAHCCHVVGAD